MRLIAALTSHNRKELTLRCLRAFEVASRHAGTDPLAVLVDDGSTDGTAEAVHGQFPWVTVERGDGSLFWNRGMYRAIATAWRLAPDHLLWLNDDTVLLPDAIAKLLKTAQDVEAHGSRTGIVVGATSDAATGELTYGGIVECGRWRRFAFAKVQVSDEAQPCHTMNGNVVLVPAAVYRQIGNLDPVFEHAMGDFDYGLRARRAGIPIVTAPGIAGHCSANQPPRDLQTADWWVRWKRLTGRKGIPFRSWLQLTRRHCGPLWPAYFVWPYVKLAIAGFVGLFRRSPGPTAHGPR